MIHRADSDHGTVVIADNRMTFDYSAGRPAIDVGNNHDIGKRPGLLVVRGNRIRNRGAQIHAGTPAIRVWRTSRRGAVRSEVERNTIQGFATAILYAGEGSAHRFRIVANRHEGIITPARRGHVEAELRGNRAP